VRNRDNVGEGDVFYSDPERAGGYIAGAPDYPAWHCVVIGLMAKKNPDRWVRVEDKS